MTKCILYCFYKNVVLYIIEVSQATFCLGQWVGRSGHGGGVFAGHLHILKVSAREYFVHVKFKGPAGTHTTSVKWGHLTDRGLHAKEPVWGALVSLALVDYCCRHSHCAPWPGGGMGRGEMVAENLGSQCAFLVPTGMFPGNLVALFFPRLKGPDFLLCFLWHLQVSQALIPHLWSVWTYYLNAGRCGSEWGVNK